MKPSLIALLAVCHAGTASAAITVTRDSTAFSSTIDQIEGDVDPDSLADWAADLGNFAGQLTINGNSTMTVALDTVAYDRWAHTGDITGTVGWTIETRLRIDSLGATTGDPGVFEIVSRSSGANARSPWFYITADGIRVRINTSGSTAALYNINLNDGQFHTYRMATVAGEPHTFWLDGVQVATWTNNDSTADTRVFLGRNGGTSVDDGTTTIDYIRFDTTGAFAPIPEPAAAALLVLASAIGLRRRR